MAVNKVATVERGLRDGDREQNTPRYRGTKAQAFPESNT